MKQSKQAQSMSKPMRAIIYCRVSSLSQQKEGDGLHSQEVRCRQHAAAKNLEVAAVFPDTISGGGDFMKRPGMVALLSFIDAQPDERFVVIFDDLKRFARDREFHFRLKEAFARRNSDIECLNYRFDDTPEGEFVETVFAAQGQLERKQHGRQVSQKMQARMENGYWVHNAPIGYRYRKTEGRGRILVADAPFDGIIGPAAFDAGAFISPQSGALAAMTKLDPIHAEFQVPTGSLRDYLENVDAGTASNIAAVTLRLANGTVYDTPGDVDFVDTTVTTGTDSVQMRARFDNPDGRLLDQELVEVTLTAQAGTPELAIPQQAVQRDVQGAFVLVVGEGSVAEQRRVEVGRTSQGFAVITNGLTPGEEVITDSVNKVRLGAPVDAAPAESN